MDKVLKIFNQTSWQLLGKLITSLSTIVILGLITRSFGETGTGLFTLTLAYLGFFALAIDLGLNAHLMPVLLQREFNLVWQRLFGLRLGLALILIPLAILGGLFWPTKEGMFKILIIIGSFMAILGPAVYTSANAIFQSRLRYDLSVIGWSAAAAATLVAVYITSKLQLSLPWVMIDYSFGWIIGSLLLIYFAGKFVQQIRPVFDFAFVKALFKQAWPVSATLILNVVYFRLDAFMLSFYRSFSEVGIYNLAYQIFQAALVVPTFIMNGYYPMMLENLNKNRSKFFADVKLAFAVMFGLGFLGTVLTVFLSPVVIGVITGGRGFAGSVEALRILAFSFPAFFGSAILMWALVSLRKYKVMLGIYLAGLILNGVLNLMFIPQFSYLAASWVTVVSEYLILVLQIMVLLFDSR